MKTLREFALETKNDKIAYLPGDTLTGELYLCLEDPVEVKAVKVILFGEGQGEWLVQALASKKKGEDGGETDGQTQDGSGKKATLVDINLVVFGFENEDKNAPPKLEIHEAGRYVYEFEFKIPETLPSTFSSPPSKDLGYAKYSLRAVIERPKKRDKTTKLSIVINHPLDPTRPELAYQPGSDVMKEVNTACLPTGTLTLESYLSQPCYKQGERILINALAENGTVKVMKEIYAKLIRRIRCKSRFGTKTYTVDSSSTHGKSVAPKNKIEWKDKAMKIPAVGPTMAGNVDIRVDYIVRVGMYEDMGSEIHVDLPVVIGTIEGKDGKYD